MERESALPQSMPESDADIFSDITAKNSEPPRKSVKPHVFPSYIELIPEFEEVLMARCAHSLPNLMCRIAEPRDVLDFLMRLLRDESDGVEKIKSVFLRSFEPDLMNEEGIFARGLVPAPDPGSISVLLDEFPHFARSGLIKAIEEDLILAKIGSGFVSLEPILMVSDPGVGKTRFVRRLLEILSIPSQSHRTIDFSSTSSGWILSGLNSSWGGSKPGEIFNALTNPKGVANPLFFLDEIEKGGSNAASNGIKPIDALHILLEPESAKNFRDEYCPIPIDASRVLWIAAANSVSDLSDSILSRFRVFHIPLPTNQEKRRIAKYIWSDLLKANSWGKLFSYDLNDEVLDKIQSESTRSMRRVLRSSAAQAWLRMEFRNATDTLLLDGRDFPDQESPKIEKKNVGFRI